MVLKLIQSKGKKMNKIRIKTLELLHQILNTKFSNDNNPDFVNDDGISYIAYDGSNGSIQVYLAKEYSLPEGEYHYILPPNEMYKRDYDEYVRKEITLNNITYIQWITEEQYNQEKENIPQERIHYYE